MQLSAPEVTRTSIGRDPRPRASCTRPTTPNPLKAAYARNCLLARRLLERGVRYVNLYCGSRASGVDGLLNWDAHKTLQRDYERHGPIFDRADRRPADRPPTQRGLLEDTLVLWTTEFGRMPTRQEGTTVGRDHNPDGFTCWMMGAGVRGGRLPRRDRRVRPPRGGRPGHRVGLLRDRAAPARPRPRAGDLATQRSRSRMTDVHGNVIRSVVTA